MQFHVVTHHLACSCTLDAHLLSKNDEVIGKWQKIRRGGLNVNDLDEKEGKGRGSRSTNSFKLCNFYSN